MDIVQIHHQDGISEVFGSVSFYLMVSYGKSVKVK